jgi:hypothetical protein
MKSRRKTVFKWILLYPVVFVLCLELALQILGWGTYYIDDYSIRTEPENAFIGHHKLGIALNTGAYSITLNDSIQFTATHLPGNHRLIPASELAENPDLLLLGCSFTYGYGVNDDETFAALLQQGFPEVSMRNSGVIGYGTVQSLMQLKEMVKKGSVKTVLLNFSSFHLMRNGLSQTYRSNLKVGYQRSSHNVESLMEQSRFPYITSCDLEIQYQPWETMYTNRYGREWSATVNWLQLTEDRRRDAAIDELRIAECIIREMETICKANNITFGVACLDTTAETEALHTALTGINWVNVGFDFSNEELTNLPYDSHPGVRGHAYIADRIKPFLNSLLHEP